MSAWTSPAACPSSSSSSSSSSSVESCGIPEAGSDPTVPPVTRPPLLDPRLLRLLARRSHLGPVKRRSRELTSPDQKDAAYWDKRRKNNEAARRSRERRRLKDLLLEGQLEVLSEENAQLRAQMLHVLEKCNPSCAAHGPAFLQADHWAPIGTYSPAAMRQQEAAARPFEATVPVFRMFNPLSQHCLIPQPDPVSISGPRLLRHGGVLGARGPVEVEMGAQRRVSCSNDTPAAPQILSPMSFLPTLEPLQRASAAPQYCVVPHLTPAALLPWPPSYLAKPSF